jgi:putative transposase
MITKAYKFRIYPTKVQEETINNCFRVNDFIYNFFLGLEQETYDVLYMYGLRNGEKKEDKHLNKWRTENKLWFNRFDASRLLTKMAKLEKYKFLKTYPSTSRTYSLKSLESGMKSFMKGGGFPKFKNKKSNKSFTIQTQKDLKIIHKNGKWHSINLPSALDFPIKKLDIKIHNELFLSPNIKTNSCTVSKRGNQYFISFQVELPGELPRKREIKKETSVGVDFGVKKIITISSDEENPYSCETRFLKNSMNELKRLQKALSQKKKGSVKYNNIKEKINKLHIKISNQRKNLQHNISSFLVNLNADTIIMEDLNLKGMTKTPNPIESNGTFLPNGKSRKSGLNASILDVGIGEIKTQVQYKSDFCGKNVVLVNPQYTSQKCNNCGFTHKENRISQSEFECKNCGHKDNADKNASKNIKQKYFDN